jgi:hypothetical protein
MTRKMITTASVVVGLVMLVAGTALADTWTATFENGTGQDQTALGATIAGLQFSTLTGGNMIYIDAATGNYNVTTGSGTIYEQGEYYVGGNVSAAVLNLSDLGKVSFSFGAASNFTIGYSSEFSFQIQAYDSSGVLLDTKTGAANTRSQSGTGLGYLQISRQTADIAYVVFGNNYGGYWMVDNVTTDAPQSSPIIPEPGALLALAMGMAGLAARVKAGKR